MSPPTFPIWQVGKLYEAEHDAGATLATLLDKHVLKNAKKDGLASVKAEIASSSEIAEIFKTYHAQLKKEWRGINNGAGPMKVPPLTVPPPLR